MKPAPFDYIRAETLSEAHKALAALGKDARILAGGQTLLPMLSMRLVRPKAVIDIMHLGALNEIQVDGDKVRIGAAVRQAGHRAQPVPAARCPSPRRRAPERVIRWALGLT